jgi:fimbrial isopeptide formation D2 family protein
MEKIRKILKGIIGCLVMVIIILGNTTKVQAIDVEDEIEAGGAPVGCVTKEVQNITTQDGLNRVGDVLEYTITLSNDEPFSTWKKVKVFDTLPMGLEFIAEFGVIKDGSLTTYSYGTANRELAIPVGDLLGEDETVSGVISDKDIVVLKFRATISESAQGTTITNYVSAEGDNAYAEAQDGGIFVEELSKAGGSITVHYQAEDGEALCEATQLDGTIDEAYQVKIKEFEGYTFKEAIGMMTGTFTSAPLNVTLIYTKNALPTSSVTVKYVDEDGNNLGDDIELSGEVGTNYKALRKEFKGYTFKEVQGDEAGLYKDEIQKVTFIYKKNSSTTSSVLVKHIDEDGNDLTEDTVLTGKIGSAFQTNFKEFEGYKLKEVRGNVEGTFTEEAQTVMYIYEKVDEANISTPVDNEKQNPTPTTPSSTLVAKKSSQNLLPKTGSNINVYPSILGLLLSSCILLKFILKHTKKKIN